MSFKFPDWFSSNIPAFREYLLPLRDLPHIAALEIGSYEGRSANWLLSNVLTHATSSLTCIDAWAPYEFLSARDTAAVEAGFDANVAKLFGERVIKIKKDSRTALTELAAAGASFSLIYIDGAHDEASVAADARLAFPLLQPGGILVFDDYAWSHKAIASRPGPAIDAFLAEHNAELELLHLGYQCFVKKRMPHAATSSEKIDVHVLAWNDPENMRIFCEHYSEFADEIFVWDRGCTDGYTLEIAQEYSQVKIVRDSRATKFCDTERFNSVTNMQFKDECWRYSLADWVVIPDLDEWVIPLRHQNLREYLAHVPEDKQILRPTGINVCGPLLRNLRNGWWKWRGTFKPDYSKPCIFRPRCPTIEFIDVCGHTVQLRGHVRGTLLTEEKHPELLALPELLLLHGKYLGSAEFMSARHQRYYSAQRPVAGSQRAKTIRSAYPVEIDEIMALCKQKGVIPLPLFWDAHRKFHECKDLARVSELLNTTHARTTRELRAHWPGLGDAGGWTPELIRVSFGLPINSAPLGYSWPGPQTRLPSNARWPHPEYLWNADGTRKE